MTGSWPVPSFPPRTNNMVWKLHWSCVREVTVRLQKQTRSENFNILFLPEMRKYPAPQRWTPPVRQKQSVHGLLLEHKWMAGQRMGSTGDARHHSVSWVDSVQSPECIHCSPFPKRRCRSECLKTHPDCVGRVQTRQHEQSKPVKRTGGKLTHGKAQGEKGESTSRWGHSCLFSF